MFIMCAAEASQTPARLHAFYSIMFVHCGSMSKHSDAEPKGICKTIREKEHMFDVF